VPEGLSHGPARSQPAAPPRSAAQAVAEALAQQQRDQAAAESALAAATVRMKTARERPKRHNPFP